MKTNTILTLLVAGAMSFTACTKKIDEKTMAEINQFGTDWTALGEKAANWSSELMQTTAKAKEFAAQQTAMMSSMANSKDHRTSPHPPQPPPVPWPPPSSQCSRQ